MVNEVYTQVQNLLNTNGYGILSPTRFVNMAILAQNRVLGDVIDEFDRAKAELYVKGMGDRLSVLQAAIDLFTESTTLSRDNGGSISLHHALPDNFMRWGNASVNNLPIERVDARLKHAMRRNYLLEPTELEPKCYIEGNKLYVLPESIGIIDYNNVPIACNEVELVYYRYPVEPNWTYVMVGGEPMFNPSDSNYQDFELPPSMFHRLVYDILGQAGLHLRDEQVQAYSNVETRTEFQKDNQ
jgi:hypothetical protein